MSIEERIKRLEDLAYKTGYEQATREVSGMNWFMKEIVEPLSKN